MAYIKEGNWRIITELDFLNITFSNPKTLMYFDDRDKAGFYSVGDYLFATNNGAIFYCPQNVTDQGIINILRLAPQLKIKVYVSFARWDFGTVYYMNYHQFNRLRQSKNYSTHTLNNVEYKKFYSKKLAYRRTQVKQLEQNFIDEIMLNGDGHVKES